MRFFKETPGMGILRNLLYAVIITIVYMLGLMVMGRFNAGFFPAYCLIGFCLSFFGWGGERLWYATIPVFFTNPFSWKAVVSHVPFWGMFGGIGYTIAIVVSKKLGYIRLDEIPIKNIFFFGSGFGSLLQLCLYILDVRINKFQSITNKEVHSL